MIMAGRAHARQVTESGELIKPGFGSDMASWRQGKLWPWPEAGETGTRGGQVAKDKRWMPTWTPCI